MISLTINGGESAIMRLKKLAEGGVGTGASKALSTYGLTVLALAQENSPVGEKLGGTFRQSWQMNEIPANGAVVAAIEITNTLPYAGPLEYGSPIGGKPWPNAGPRTVADQGRVWSSQAKGGVIGPNLQSIAEGAVAAILEVLKNE